MKHHTAKTHRRHRRRRHISAIGALCWIASPLAMITLLFLDGTGIYPFSKERLLVIGIGVLVALLPFFEEISVKTISFKKERKDAEKSPHQQDR